MSAQTWLTVGQLTLTGATAMVAFAVYRVQADKLFLEMRDKRSAALEEYQDAIRGYLSHITSLSRENVDLDASALQAVAVRLWTAERGIAAWFGPECVAAAKVVEAKLKEALAAKVDWCITAKPDPREFPTAIGKHLAAGHSYTSLAELCRPYIAAGRRGLPLSQGWHIWWQARWVRTKFTQKK